MALSNCVVYNPIESLVTQDSADTLPLFVANFDDAINPDPGVACITSVVLTDRQISYLSQRVKALMKAALACAIDPADLTDAFAAIVGQLVDADPLTAGVVAAAAVVDTAPTYTFNLTTDTDPTIWDVSIPMSTSSTLSGN